MRRTILILATVSIVGAILLSGCTTMDDYRTASPAKLDASARWMDGQHVDVTLRNVGGTSLNPSGTNMTLVAPNGTTMPVHWNQMAPTIDPGKSVNFELHAMMMDDGTMGLTMDHAMAGTHMPMPSGDYMLRVGTTTTMVAQEG